MEDGLDLNILYLVICMGEKLQFVKEVSHRKGPYYIAWKSQIQFDQGLPQLFVN